MFEHPKMGDFAHLKKKKSIFVMYRGKIQVLTIQIPINLTRPDCMNVEHLNQNQSV